jgi:hypothetical protein
MSTAKLQQQGDFFQGRLVLLLLFSYLCRSVREK